MKKVKNILTTGDVARICQVSPKTVLKWFDSGRLKGYRIPGSKDRRIRVGELICFMKAHNMPTRAVPSGKIRVLILESNKEAASALGVDLLTRGYEVQTAQTNFEAGIAIAAEFPPHVVLVNLLAKAINAREICRSIRADEDLQAIKILAFGGELSQSESATLLKQPGFDGYIPNRDANDVINGIEKAFLKE